MYHVIGATTRTAAVVAVSVVDADDVAGDALVESEEAARASAPKATITRSHAMVYTALRRSRGRIENFRNRIIQKLIIIIKKKPI